MVVPGPLCTPTASNAMAWWHGTFSRDPPMSFECAPAGAYGAGCGGPGLSSRGWAHPSTLLPPSLLLPPPPYSLLPPSSSSLPRPTCASRVGVGQPGVRASGACPRGAHHRHLVTRPAAVRQCPALVPALVVPSRGVNRLTGRRKSVCTPPPLLSISMTASTGGVVRYYYLRCSVLLVRGVSCLSVVSVVCL